MTLTSRPNKIKPETTKERVIRLAKQKIGSTKGIHPRTLAAQEEAQRIKNRPKRARSKS